MSDCSGLRIDQWLSFVRFFKTRSLATAAVKGGHVRINGARAKPGARVSPGDRVEIRRQRLDYDLRVVRLPERRGPAAEAEASYIESAESRERRDALLAGLRSDRASMPVTHGRPDKKTRRQLRQRGREGE